MVEQIAEFPLDNVISHDLEHRQFIYFDCSRNLGTAQQHIDRFRVSAVISYEEMQQWADGRNYENFFFHGICFNVALSTYWPQARFRFLSKTVIEVATFLRGTCRRAPQDIVPCSVHTFPFGLIQNVETQDDNNWRLQIGFAFRDKEPHRDVFVPLIYRAVFPVPELHLFWNDEGFSAFWILIARTLETAIGNTTKRNLFLKREWNGFPNQLISVPTWSNIANQSPLWISFQPTKAADLDLQSFIGLMNGLKRHFTTGVNNIPLHHIIDICRVSRDLERDETKLDQIYDVLDVGDVSGSLLYLKEHFEKPRFIPPQWNSQWETSKSTLCSVNRNEHIFAGNFLVNYRWSRFIADLPQLLTDPEAVLDHDPTIIGVKNESSPTMNNTTMNINAATDDATQKSKHCRCFWSFSLVIWFRLAFSVVAAISALIVAIAFISSESNYSMYVAEIITMIPTTIYSAAQLYLLCKDTYRYQWKSILFRALSASGGPTEWLKTT